MKILLKANEDISQYIGSENSDKRTDLLALIQNKIGQDVNPSLTVEPGGHLRLICQQFEHRPFPQSLIEQKLTGPYYQAQFKNTLVELKPDAVVLSIEADLTAPLYQHKSEHYLFAPEPGWEQQWTAEQRNWLVEAFRPLGLISPEHFEQNLSGLVQKIKAEVGSAVIIANASTLDPGDERYSFRDQADSLSLRTNRFNLALLRVSTQEGISILGVDRLMAEAGGSHVLEPFRYSEKANTILRRELVRVLEDLDLIETDATVYKMAMPYIDLTTKQGLLHAWHKQVGDKVKDGDVLFDLQIQFKKLKRTQSSHHLSRGKSSKAGGKMEKVLVQVVAKNSGILREIHAQPESKVAVGSLVAVFTAENEPYSPDQPLDLTSAGKFRAAVIKQSVARPE